MTRAWCTLLLTACVGLVACSRNDPAATTPDAAHDAAASQDARTTADASTPPIDPPDTGKTVDTSRQGRDIGDRVDVDQPDVGDLAPISLQSSVDDVQPMTGIVLWESSSNDTPAKQIIQLEYAYVGPDTIVVAQDTYDWSSFDALLDRIAGRAHQAIVRFYYVYPGRQTTVPQYIKALGDYDETVGQSEGRTTSFPDWSHPELERAHLAFYTEFAERYDDDPRIAFLQVGFGLWGEYHIYDGPNELGEQFPDKTFQADFFRHMDASFDTLHWSISIDAGSDSYSPFASDPSLLQLRFGNFDDSFMHERHDEYNESMWDFFGHEQRYLRAPHGGELSYYTDYDQEHALDVGGIHGRTFEALSSKFHITYMIGNDQPDVQPVERIRSASLALGYKFRVTSFEASPSHAVVEIENVGIAPIYYDAYPAVNGVRAPQSLKGLAPGASLTAVVSSGGEAPTLTIESDRLIPGQTIGYEADL